MQSTKKPAKHISQVLNKFTLENCQPILGRVTINDRRTNYKAETANSAASGSAEVTLLIIILTILLPPLGVALVFGLSGEFWISLLLTLLFYFPGLIYSLIVIL